MKVITSFLLFLLCATSGLTQVLTQLRDLETDGEFPADLTVSGNRMFFVSATRRTGEELWVLDPGASPRRVSAAGPRTPVNLRDMGGTLFFSSAYESFWRSDGTAAGTVELDRTTTPGGSYHAVALGKVNSRVVFGAQDKIWSTDGTAAGTKVIVAASCTYNGAAAVGADGRLYFAAGPRDTIWFGTSLWATDGTVGGTHEIALIDRTVGIHEIRAAGKYIFIRAGHSTDSGIWRSDGTAAGTVRLRDPATGDPYTFPKMAVAGDKLVFTEIGDTLYAADGKQTQALAKVVQPGGFVLALKAVQGVAYCSVHNADRSISVWKTDGTAVGTILLPQMAPAPFVPRPDDYTGETAEDVVGLGGWIYYFAQTQQGWGLWRMNAANGQVEAVADLPDNLTSAQPKQLTMFDGAIYFSAYDGREGRKLWRSDGTPTGTRLASDAFSGSYTSFAVNLTPGENGRAYFLTRSQTGDDVILWQTDGSRENTYPLVSGLVSRTDLHYPEGQYTQIFENDGIVYFTGHDGVHGHELWRTDRTGKGTFLIKDFYRRSNGFFDPTPLGFTRFKDAVYFAANDVASGWQLWRTDGTIAGTVRVSNIGGGACDRIFGIRKVGETLFFQADDFVHGAELWKSDGTAEGTMLVKDIVAGKEESSPRLLAELGGRLFFSASSATGSAQLWITDGTESGTTLLKPPGSMRAPSSVTDAVIYKNRLYFVAEDDSHGKELWVSDGSDSGTQLFVDLYPGAGSSSPDQLTVMGEALYFGAAPGEWRRRLWKTYGTAEATSTVGNFWPGYIRSAGRLLYMADNENGSQTDLWRSDGTANGTYRLPLNPHGSSTAYGLLAVGEQMLFFAYDGFTGHELWSARLDPAPPGARLANISTRGHVGPGDSNMIGGFIVIGSGSQRVIVRAIGPSLSGQIEDTLGDPELSLYDANGSQLASNDNWQEQNATEIGATGVPPTDNAEAAIVTTLVPGPYTARVSSADGGTGVGLVEVYNLEHTQTAEVANISTRGEVLGGDKKLIGGFIIQGQPPRPVIIRALGASLRNGTMPLPNRLSDSVLELFDANGTLLARNDNWRDEQAAAIQASQLAPEAEQDAALLITLPSGAYTAQVSGANNAHGIALVEVYQLP